jgi:antitoxin component of RelBE/YafQ-DinJ toxin-antitoxin module
MKTVSKRSNRDSLLKVRVKTTTKAKVISAAEQLDLDQSTLVRVALQEYISRHCPNAA